jgi:predicted transcriptional regulator
MPTDLRRKLPAALAAAGVKQAEIAKRVGLSPQAISAFLQEYKSRPVAETGNRPDTDEAEPEPERPPSPDRIAERRQA